MIPAPADLCQHLRKQGQDHVLAFWDRLNDAERTGLLAQVSALDLPRLAQLYKEKDRPFPLPAPDRIKPIPVIRTGQGETLARARGEEALRKGQVAVVLVAGGQGSRLGFEHPKGMYAIGPISKRSLFQIHSEKVLALTRRFGRPIPLLVMTSDATHDETTAYFQENLYFGLAREEVAFFRQGTMPALDLATGKMLLEGPGRLFTSPNGHGGTLTALADSGLLDQLDHRGIKQVFYFQVDNPLIKIADPFFLGHHLAADADVSSKIVAKETPTDKVGNLVQVDGRCTIIEYSDLPLDLAQRTGPDGKLMLWAGNPAIHIFAVDFLKKVTQQGSGLPFHVARKKVPCLDAAGNLLKPDTENALKFEMFIFDVLPMADRWKVVETSAREEFAPLKNGSGPDSPETVHRAISTLAADWLTQAGVEVPRRGDSTPTYSLEISPLLALNAEELAAKVDRSLQITGPTYLTERGPLAP
jgi:UDP-N-acetylglucosamine/UDP-N-acetylgalactosamine diphosphorylase